MWRDFKIVAPSFATVTVWPLPVDCKMLPCSRQRKNQNKKSQVLQYPITSEDVIGLREREQISIQQLRHNGEWDTERIERDWEKRKFYPRIETGNEKGMVKQEEGRHACLRKRCIREYKRSTWKQKEFKYKQKTTHGQFIQVWDKVVHTHKQNERKN